jgi:hypothetical protein
MIAEPTDEELARLIDMDEWIMSKRKDGDPFKRELQIRLFCMRAAREALQALKERRAE